VLEKQRRISLVHAVGLGEFFSNNSAVIFLLSINKALVPNRNIQTVRSWLKIQKWMSILRSYQTSRTASILILHSTS
jgi:hypothetical protein